MPVPTLQTNDLVSLNIKLTSLCYFSMGANFQHHRRRRCRHRHHVGSDCDASRRRCSRLSCFGCDVFRRPRCDRVGGPSDDEQRRHFERRARLGHVGVSRRRRQSRSQLSHDFDSCGQEIGP